MRPEAGEVWGLVQRLRGGGEAGDRLERGGGEGGGGGERGRGGGGGGEGERLPEHTFAQ